MKADLKIGELAKLTGLTAKTIRYYELLKLLPKPPRTESGYRLYSEADVQRLEFVKKAKRIGLSLEDIRDILTLHATNQPPCVHVLALIDQRLAYIDVLLDALQKFREDLSHLRQESAERLDSLPEGAAICSIVEQGIHAKGELALTWLQGREKAKRLSRST